MIKMDIRRPRKIKWIEDLREWWKYRKATLTISVNEDGLIILEGVVNQRIVINGNAGIAKDLILRKELDIRGSLSNAGGGTWSLTEDFTITMGGSFTMKTGELNCEVDK